MGRHDPPQPQHPDLRVAQRLADLERGLLQAVQGSRQGFQVGVGEVEFAGGSAKSLLTTITGIHGRVNAIYQVTPINTYGNDRFPVVVEPSLTQFKVYLVSTVGTPGAGTKEKFYWSVTVE